MSLIHAYQNRGKTFDITVDGPDGAITPGGNDVLRIVIGRAGRLGVALADAQLVVTSAAATANGSSITIGGGEDSSHRIRLDASDLTFDPGIYSMLVDYFDNADAEEWKNVDRQCFSLEAT